MADSNQNPSTDLWSLAQESEKKQGFQRNLEKTVIVIGDKGSGKTNFVNILKNQQATDRTLPTVGLDYQYVRRTNANRKELMHSYELGGGRDSQRMLTLPLSKENFRDSYFILAIDLSKPHSMIESANFWFDEIRKQIEAFNSISFVTAEEKESKSNYDFAVSAKFESHPDRTRIKHLPIQTIVVGTKYDIYERTDAENRKWVARLLRFIAHSNGASLYYSSCKNEDLFQSTRSIFNNVLFGKSLAQYYQQEHLKPIQISSGKDEIAKMGLPQAPQGMSPLDALKKVITESIPKEEGASGNQQREILSYMDKFPESRIDSIRAEKDKEMQVMSKEFISFFQGNSPVKKSNNQRDHRSNDDDDFFETSASHHQEEEQQQQENHYNNQSKSRNAPPSEFNSQRQQQQHQQQQFQQSYQQNQYSNTQTDKVESQQQRVNQYAKQNASGSRSNANSGSMDIQAPRSNKLSSLGGLPQI